MIIFALRHADRTSGDDLSPAGQERAKLLARMLSESGVSIAYRSDAVRAARTLEPLEQRLGAALTVKEIGFPGPDGVTAHIRTIVKKIDALPHDAVVAVVSHSNTVGPILRGLGADFDAQIAETEFDKLFVMFRGTSASSTVVLMRYGVPT
jgi:phosphohistidine phosphatase SixA